MCCSNIKIKPPVIPASPGNLKKLMLGVTEESRHFHITSRNCIKMTPFPVTKEVFEAGFMPNFNAHGKRLEALC